MGVVCSWLFGVIALFGIGLLCYLAGNCGLSILLLIVLSWFLSSLLLLVIIDLRFICISVYSC